jgi:NADH/NAD ratio-sensing transcriptional regulator Rex
MVGMVAAVDLASEITIQTQELLVQVVKVVVEMVEQKEAQEILGMIILAAVEVVMVTPVHLETNPQLPVVQAVVDVVKLETHPTL